MKTLEIKKKLIEEINSSTNKGLLEEIYNYLSQENKLEKPYELNNDQNMAINEARVQIKDGKSLGNEEANKDIEKWLKE